jgi:hypothetical protein
MSADIPKAIHHHFIQGVRKKGAKNPSLFTDRITPAFICLTATCLKWGLFQFQETGIQEAVVNFSAENAKCESKPKKDFRNANNALQRITIDFLTRGMLYITIFSSMR